MNWRILVVGFSLAIVVDICAANNDTWDKIREKKARLVKKLKKDFRKLKKQEGAVKLVGSENGGHEGNDSSLEIETFRIAFDKKSFEYSQTVLKLIFLKNNFSATSKSWVIFTRVENRGNSKVRNLKFRALLSDPRSANNKMEELSVKRCALNRRLT